RRISASKSSSCSLRIGLADSRNSISTPGAPLSGFKSKSGEVGETSAFLKSPESATLNFAAMALLLSAGFPELRHRFGKGIMQHPHIARIADEIKTLTVNIAPLLDAGYQPAQRLVVLSSGRN